LKTKKDERRKTGGCKLRDCLLDGQTADVGDDHNTISAGPLTL